MEMMWRGDSTGSMERGTEAQIEQLVGVVEAAAAIC